MKSTPLHARVAPPTPPGPWVDEDACACGASYARYRFGVTFAEAVERVRVVNGREWYVSRGPVLWMMRVQKLAAWYLEHAACAAALEWAS